MPNRKPCYQNIFMMKVITLEDLLCCFPSTRRMTPSPKQVQCQIIPLINIISCHYSRKHTPLKKNWSCDRKKICNFCGLRGLRVDPGGSENPFTIICVCSLFTLPFSPNFKTTNFKVRQRILISNFLLYLNFKAFSRRKTKRSKL